MVDIASIKGGAAHKYLIEWIEKNLGDVPGDVIEIGAFVGHFTARLSEWANKRGKFVYAVDCFDTEHDEAMGDFYIDWVDGKSQYDAYKKNIDSCHNVYTIPVDSTRMAFLPPRGFCLAYIDGGHTFDVVLSDFNFVMARMNYGGIVIFDDYQHDLPEVTRAINHIRDHWRTLISQTWKMQHISLAIRLGEA